MCLNNFIICKGNVYSSVHEKKKKIFSLFLLLQLFFSDSSTVINIAVININFTTEFTRHIYIYIFPFFIDNKIYLISHAKRFQSFCRIVQYPIKNYANLHSYIRVPISSILPFLTESNSVRSFQRCR